MGSPQDIQCIVSTVSGVELSSVMISWMGPGGESITNDSRVTISPTTSSGNNYTSILQFTYLMREDEGSYNCKVDILETYRLVTFEITNIIGMFILENYGDYCLGAHKVYKYNAYAWFKITNPTNDSSYIFKYMHTLCEFKCYAAR